MEFGTHKKKIIVFASFASLDFPLSSSPLAHSLVYPFLIYFSLSNAFRNVHIKRIFVASLFDGPSSKTVFIFLLRSSIGQSLHLLRIMSAFMQRHKIFGSHLVLCVCVSAITNSKMNKSEARECEFDETASASKSERTERRTKRTATNKNNMINFSTAI